jgi:hypothetical protein
MTLGDGTEMNRDVHCARCGVQAMVDVKVYDMKLESTAFRSALRRWSFSGVRNAKAGATDPRHVQPLVLTLNHVLEL